MNKPSEYTRALILLQSFETFWAYCFLTDGELYTEECKEVAKHLIKSLNSIYTTDKNIFNSKILTLDNNDDDKLIGGVIKKLKIWIKTNNRFPYDEIFENNYQISYFTMGLKIYLLNHSKFDVQFPIIWSSHEYSFSKYRAKWKPHLPHHMLKTVSNDLEEKLSNSNTIVVVGDIRKSQDLMTYSPSSDAFRENMLHFVQMSRKLIKENYGIFDKFTGDGFIAYFNEEVCNRIGRNYLDCFSKFVIEQMNFSINHFESWVKSIRKLPTNSIGLTIGADVGKIDYKDIEGHLFVIGDAIVWANRVCSAGKGHDILLNNILFNLLKDRNNKLIFEKIESLTKAGEHFVAYKMLL